MIINVSGVQTYDIRVLASLVELIEAQTNRICTRFNPIPKKFLALSSSTNPLETSAFLLSAFHRQCRVGILVCSWCTALRNM